MNDDLKARLEEAAKGVMHHLETRQDLFREARDRIVELERKHQEKVQAIGKLEDDEQAAERRAEAAEANCERLRRDNQLLEELRSTDAWLQCALLELLYEHGIEPSSADILKARRKRRERLEALDKLASVDQELGLE